MNLTPCEPYATRILYGTYSLCARIKSSPKLYSPCLFTGTAFALVVGIVEFLAEKIFHSMRIAKHTFDLDEWKSQCRLSQLKAAFITVQRFSRGEINPTLLPTYGQLLQDLHYYESLRHTDQWVYMDEKAPLVLKMKEDLAGKLNPRFSTLLKASDLELLNAPKNNFTRQFCESRDLYHKALQTYMGYREYEALLSTCP